MPPCRTAVNGPCAKNAAPKRPSTPIIEEGAARGIRPRPDRIGPDAQVLARERRKQIERAIADLPEVYRKVFLLADVDGQPNADIAEAMRLSLSAVKSRLHRARQLMRGALAPYFEESAV